MTGIEDTLRLIPEEEREYYSSMELTIEAIIMLFNFYLYTTKQREMTLFDYLEQLTKQDHSKQDYSYDKLAKLLGELEPKELERPNEVALLKSIQSCVNYYRERNPVAIQKFLSSWGFSNPKKIEELLESYSYTNGYKINENILKQFINYWQDIERTDLTKQLEEVSLQYYMCTCICTELDSMELYLKIECAITYETVESNKEIYNEWKTNNIHRLEVIYQKEALAILNKMINSISLDEVSGPVTPSDYDFTFSLYFDLFESGYTGFDSLYTSFEKGSYTILQIYEAFNRFKYRKDISKAYTEYCKIKKKEPLFEFMIEEEDDKFLSDVYEKAIITKEDDCLKYKLDFKDIRGVFNKLIEYEYIASNSKLEVFIYLLTGKDVGNGSGKIFWIKKNNLLAAFLKKLAEKFGCQAEYRKATRNIETRDGLTDKEISNFSSMARVRDSLKAQINDILADIPECDQKK